ncbi:hypothetical protein ENBRE01_1494 [Enteropsectra breve]|nr:hypothetical protein ENBRE01_1494 [Enteropsectra breve]
MQLSIIMAVVATVRCMPPGNELVNPNTSNSSEETPQSGVKRATTELQNLAIKKKKEEIETKRLNELIQKRNARREYLSSYNYEPLDIMTEKEAQLVFQRKWTKRGLYNFILDYSGFYNSIEHEFISRSEPTLWWFKCLTNGSKVDLKFEVKALHNDGKPFTSFNEMLLCVIKKLKAENKNHAKFFSNKLDVRSFNEDLELERNANFNFHTINFNNAMNCEVPEDMDMEKICLDSLRGEADVKCFVEAESSRKKDLNIFFNLRKESSNIIIITVDQYIKKIRDAGKELPLEFKLTNGSEAASTYRVKALIFREKTQIVGLDLSLVEASTLDIFGEEEKAAWLRKMLTNPVFVIYERV